MRAGSSRSERLSRLYERPASLFAAQFLGDANVFRGTVVDANGLRLADGTVIRSVLPATPTAIVRPEKISVLPAGAPVTAMPSMARSSRRSIPAPA